MKALLAVGGCWLWRAGCSIDRASTYLSLFYRKIKSSVHWMIPTPYLNMMNKGQYQQDSNKSSHHPCFLNEAKKREIESDVQFVRSLPTISISTISIPKYSQSGRVAGTIVINITKKQFHLQHQHHRTKEITSEGDFIIMHANNIFQTRVCICWLSLVQRRSERSLWFFTQRSVIHIKEPQASITTHLGQRRMEDDWLGVGKGWSSRGVCDP